MNVEQVLEEWSDIEESNSDESSDSEGRDSVSVSGRVDEVWREATGKCLPVFIPVKTNNNILVNATALGLVDPATRGIGAICQL